MIVGVPERSFPGERRVRWWPAPFRIGPKQAWTVVWEREPEPGQAIPTRTTSRRAQECRRSRRSVRALTIVVQILFMVPTTRPAKSTFPFPACGHVLMGFLRPSGSIEPFRNPAL